MRIPFRPAIILFAFYVLLTGLAYPLAITGLAQVLFPNGANGSVVEGKRGIVGSHLVGQAFASDRYFWPRPSAAGEGYDGLASSGSNLGAISQKLLDRISSDATRVKRAAGAARLPAEAVTASGSGLDPDISPAYARLQAGRVARARNLPADTVARLVEGHIAQPIAGLLGEPRVNVLELNLALDAIPPA